MDDDSRRRRRSSSRAPLSLQQPLDQVGLFQAGRDLDTGLCGERAQLGDAELGEAAGAILEVVKLEDERW